MIDATRVPSAATPVLTLAPTGPVATKQDNPHLPTQPDEIAAAATRAYEAGFSVVHVHLRDLQDRPTADLDIARRTMDLIREQSPILIQISTGVGLGVPFDQRAGLVELSPTMATLNPCSMTFGRTTFDNPPDAVERLAGRMQELGVKPELEIYDTGHLDVALDMAERGLLEGPLQFSIVLGVRGGMAPTPTNLITMVNRLPAGSIWQVVAIGAQNRQLSAIALAMGGNARTGLEDTLRIRRGVDATNDDHIRSIRGITDALGLAPAPIEETIRRLGLASPATV